MKDVEMRKGILARLFAAAGALALVGLSCHVARSPAHWNERWGPVVAHRTFPGDCGICHTPRNWRTIRKDFAFDHEQETGHRLIGPHAEAACLRCHNDRGPVARFVDVGCGGCHADPHVAVLGPDCRSCHEPKSWEPTTATAQSILTPFHSVPAHSIPPCNSCHTPASPGPAQMMATQCAHCHSAASAPASQ